MLNPMFRFTVYVDIRNGTFVSGNCSIDIIHIVMNDSPGRFCS